MLVFLDYLNDAFLFFEEISLPFIPKLFVLSFDALESLSVGRLRNVVLELVDHLDVLNIWFGFLFFFLIVATIFVTFFDDCQKFFFAVL